MNLYKTGHGFSSYMIAMKQGIFIAKLTGVYSSLRLSHCAVNITVSE